MVDKHLKHFKLICCETYFSEKIKPLVLETRAEFIPFLESLAHVIYAYLKKMVGDSVSWNDIAQSINGFFLKINYSLKLH